ncbi:type IV pilin protein [Halomonas sp. WWR20]
MARQHGFSLIELMICVAIIGILAGIAWPSYERYVLRSHRTEAQATMQEMAQRLERRYSQTYSYGTEKSGKPSEMVPTLSPDTVPASGMVRYQISVDITDGGGDFIITATPQGGQASDSCGTLTFSQSGNRAPASCW